MTKGELRRARKQARAEGKPLRSRVGLELLRRLANARIGGSSASQYERERSVSWRTFQAADTQLVTGTWRDQCRCGSMQGKLYRGLWWCRRCGRQKGREFPRATQVK